MTKVTIIEVDLGETIENIISDDVKIITEKNQRNIDKALEASKQAQEASQKKSNTRKLQSQKYNMVLAKIYDVMTDRHSRGDFTSITEMLKLANPVITSPTSLLMRLKSYISKHHDSEYVLKKCKRNNVTHYQLIEYNKD